MAIQTINPATGKLIKTFIPATEAQIDKKLTKAENAFHNWKKLSIKQRIEYIKRLSVYLQAHTKDFAKLITLEMGRPISDAIAEIDKSVAICTYYIENGERFLQEQHIPTDAAKSYVRYDPLGIILGIMPWNYPFTQVFRPMIPALIAGNVFVLKHASNVPQCSQAILDLFVKTKFPHGVFTAILIEGNKVSHIIADDRIAAVTVTGSEQTGSKVAEVAGAHLKKTVLELGGSDAFIVLADADIDKTVEQAIKARTLNAGQACNSPKRFILSHKIAQEFTDKFIDKVKKLKIGDPMNPQTNIGPLAREDLRDRLDKQVKESIKKGAHLLYGGKKIEGPGFFYEMTVVDNVKKGMPLFDEEVFGPVAVLITVKSDEEAIKIANDTHLGLSASVWTTDVTHAHPFIDNLHVGLVFVNQVVRSDPRLPFGGVKKSGYGRELGEFGIKELTNIKTVVIK